LASDSYNKSEFKNDQEVFITSSFLVKLMISAVHCRAKNDDEK